jgi:hypothetical protein
MEQKILSDEELQKLGEDFARLNLQDRDNVVFDFEVDIKRMAKRLDVKRLKRRDRKYIKAVKEFIMGVVLKAYLKDMMLVGIKKTNRYKRFYVNGENS